MLWNAIHFEKFGQHLPYPADGEEEPGQNGQCEAVRWADIA
jgi:hypothetical protein